MSLLSNTVEYSAKHDRLVIHVDDGPNDVDAYYEYESEDGILTLTFNRYTGGLIDVELSGLTSTFDDEAPDYIKYDADGDAIAISLTDDNNPDGLCDMIYNKPDKHILITANRNRVGNLTGIDIVGMEALIGTLICQKN
tara:strand:+ start:131 stop:547 length:417 start_codon:yes stop_codon:yes gene_type:complete